MERIFEALDRTLKAGGVAHSDVEIVCLTGGTSRMPIIEAELARRLPQAARRRLKSFHSVVQGLARHAEQLARQA